MNPNLFRQKQRQISLQLTAWAVTSILVSLPLWRLGSPFWRAFAVQQGAWGAVDGVIAAAGMVAARRNPSDTPAKAHAEARKLRRLLLLNAGLDICYLLTGAWLLRRRPGEAAGRQRRGHGLGVVIQGGFLLIFDTFHAVRLDAALRRETG